MKLKSVFLPNSVPEIRLVTWVLSCIVLFLLPHPLLGQTTGPMTITEDTTLTENHEFGNIIIGKNHITLDCAGFSVMGPGTPVDVGPPSGPPVLIDIGIMLTKRKDVTVENCHVHGFQTAFRLERSKRNQLRDNTATDNNRFGFLLIDSDKNELQRNTATDNGDDSEDSGKEDGFALFNSDENSLVDNTADNNFRNGFFLLNSTTTVLWATPLPIMV